MTRAISVTLQTEVEKRITTPGCLIEILFPSGPARFSSRGDLNVLGQDWAGWDVTVSGLTFQGVGGSGEITMLFGNADLSISSLVLGDGAVGRAVRVWCFYGDEPIDADTWLVFAGLIKSAKIPSALRVSMTAAARAGSVLRLPRHYITKEDGFTLLPAKGATITFNNEVYRAESEE